MRSRDVLTGNRKGLFLGLVIFALASTVNAQETANMRLAWDANSEPNLAGYKLYYGTASRQYAGSINVGNVTTAELVGLLRGTTYYVAVTAYNTAGLESEFSNEVVHTIPRLPVNYPPTLDPIADVLISEDSGVTLVALTGISAGNANEAQPLNISVSSSNPTLIPAPAVMYTSPEAIAYLGVQPNPNLSGSSVITVVVRDGQATSNIVTRAFTVSVRAVNDQPFFNALADIVVPPGSNSLTVPLTGIHAGANESQPMTISAFSSRPEIVPHPVVSYTSPGASGSLRLSPRPNTNGSTVITVTLNDGAIPNGTFSRAFVVTIGVDNNELPVISQIADQIIIKNRVSGYIPFTITDVDTSTAALTIAVRTSNPALIPLSSVSISGTGSNRQMIIQPVNGATGTAVVTLLVSDGLGATSTSFDVEVRSGPVLDSIL